MQTIFLYGSYGYTGNLIVELAREKGISLMLGGRNEIKLKQQSQSSGYPYTVCSLQHQERLNEALKAYPLIINAAGPFSQTFEPVIRACLNNKSHYIDITGEIGVFEKAAAFHQEALEKNITVLPGAGFDVVPTDCLAAMLKKALPDAHELKLAFAPMGKSRPSRGTSLTMAENLGGKGMIRKNGQLMAVPIGHEGFEINFGIVKRFVMSIPWGDVSTAWYSTGIPTITTYMAISPKTYNFLRYQSLFNWLLSTSFVKAMVKKQIDKRPAGPSAEQRANSFTLVWGEVKNEKKQSIQQLLKVPEGYTTTAEATLLIAGKVLEGRAPIGFQTPSSAFGADLIFEIPGTELVEKPKRRF